MIKDDKLIFIVNKNHVVSAIGKQGENIKRLRELTKKNIDVIGFSDQLEVFIKNVFHNFKINGVNIENRGDKPLVYVSVDLRDKGKIIGKNGSNLNLAREIVNRHFEVADIIIS
jgi:N utilization substance protein A